MKERKNWMFTYKSRNKNENCFLFFFPAHLHHLKPRKDLQHNSYNANTISLISLLTIIHYSVQSQLQNRVSGKPSGSLDNLPLPILTGICVTAHNTVCDWTSSLDLFPQCQCKSAFKSRTSGIRGCLKTYNKIKNISSLLMFVSRVKG